MTTPQVNCNPVRRNKLDELAVRINDEHRDCLAAVRESLIHARNCGSLLLQAKESLNHGEWLPWLRRDCEFSERTAQAYMKVARNWPELSKTQRVADLSFRDALQLLQEPKPEKQKSLPSTDLDDLGQFFAVSRALREVRDNKLYRRDYSTFEEYCLARWGLRADLVKLIDLAPAGGLEALRDAQA